MVQILMGGQVSGRSISDEVESGRRNRFMLLRGGASRLSAGGPILKPPSAPPLELHLRTARLYSEQDRSYRDHANRNEQEGTPSSKDRISKDRLASEGNGVFRDGENTGTNQEDLIHFQWLIEDSALVEGGALLEDSAFLESSAFLEDRRSPRA